MKALDKFKYVLKSARDEMSVVELIFCTIVRICLLAAAIIDTDPLKKLIFMANLAGTFVYPIIRLFGKRDGFFARITFHVNTIVCFSSFVGYFLGHATNFGDLFSSFMRYDHVQHLIAGVTMTIGGLLFSKAADVNKKASPMLHSICAVGFSCFTMVFWELFEFISDYFITDAANQDYRFNPPDDFFFFKVFGFPQAGEQQFPVFDTMFDMMCAFLTTAITAVVIFIVLEKRQKKKV